MRHTGLIFALTVVGLLIPSCREDSVIHPKTGPGTEYPCGVQGRSCAPVAPGKCCSLNEVCGYKGPFSTCPEGYCCYTGGEGWPRVGASPDGGADGNAKMRPQVAEQP